MKEITSFLLNDANHVHIIRLFCNMYDISSHLLLLILRLLVVLILILIIIIRLINRIEC